MKTDSLSIHTEDVRGTIGDFYGTSIRQWNPLDTEIRELSDAQQRVRYFLGAPDGVLEVLPGEAIKDNLIRRQTTAEVLGEEFYEAKVPEGKQIPLHAGVVQDSVALGKLLTWRPGNQDFAVLHEEVANELPA